MENNVVSESSWKKYLPKKIKVGLSGHFYPIYGSVEWGKSSQRRRRRR
jgi:poly-D-alanine transfer protein DltD